LLVESQLIKAPLGLTRLKANVLTKDVLNSLPVEYKVFQSIPASYIFVILGAMLRAELPWSQSPIADRKM